MPVNEKALEKSISETRCELETLQAAFEEALKVHHDGPLRLFSDRFPYAFTGRQMIEARLWKCKEKLAYTRKFQKQRSKQYAK